MTAERLAGQREATLAGFAAALAATGEISEMLTTAAREIAAAIGASSVVTALWSSDDNAAITGWPRGADGQVPSAAATAALDEVRRTPAASVALLPGDGDAALLAAPLGGTGSSAIVAEFPAGAPAGAEARELFSILTSHLGQVLAKARDYELRSASQAILLRAVGPAEALTDLDTFAGRIPGAECATMFCAIIDHAAGTVAYSCAGHPPPILVTAGGERQFLDLARSLPLGMLPADWQRPQAAAALPAGATLMLYTDGLVERRSQPLDKGIDAASVALAERGQDHPDVVADHVMAAMTPAAGYDDDVAVLIYRHPPAPLTVQVSADDPSCLAFLRSELRRWLSAAGVGNREASDIMIAAGEATANAVEHAAGGRPTDAAPVLINLAARADHAMIRLTVSDTGTWRPPPADREHPAPGTRGHGVIFMHALSEVTIEPSDQGTTVTLTKELKS